MDQNEIFARRFKNARIMKGYSVEALAHEIGDGFSKESIAQAEKGQMALSSATLIAFAKALDQPVDYFFRPFALKFEPIKFRKVKSRLPANQEARIQERILDLVERYLSIEEICHAEIQFSSPFQTPISTPEQVKAAAERLREEWAIGKDGIVRVIDLLEEHGVKVIEIEDLPSFDGLCTMVNDRYPVIALNQSFCSERKRFTALHELGHLMLTFAQTVSEKDEESLCNLFASEMLILEPIFKQFLGKKRRDISYQELRSIQKQYGISCDALMYKAKDSGVITDQRYKTYCIQKNTNAFFKERVEQSIYPDETSERFVRLIYKALSDEQITLSKAASLLRQSVEQVREDLALV